jgi:hypothetical protein
MLHALHTISLVRLPHQAEGKKCASTDAHEPL